MVELGVGDGDPGLPAGQRTRGRRNRGAHGGERHIERGKDVLVEAPLALEQSVQRAEELTRLGALNHPVIVGAGHRHHLGDPQLPNPVVRDLGEFGGVVDRADRDDAPLARHQPGDRSRRTQAARIGKRDGGALERVREQLVGARPFHQRLIGLMELREAHGFGAMDHRHQQASAAILALDVHRQTEVDRPGAHSIRHAVGQDVGRGHDRVLLGRQRDGVTDQMSEGDLLGTPGRLERVIQLPAPGLQQGHRQLPEGRGGRDRETLGHVAGETCGGALDLDGARRERWVFRWLSGRSLDRGGGRLDRSGGYRCFWGADLSSRFAIGLSVYADDSALEEPPPFGRHRVGVAEELLVERLGEPGVGGFEDVGVHYAAAGSRSNGSGGEDRAPSRR